MLSLRLLFHAGSLVVADKPAGQLVHNSAWAGPREHTLTDDVRAAWPHAVPVHRVDRQTSGCVVFATTAAGAAAAQATLAASSKDYVALVRGHVSGVIDVDHALDDEEHGRGDGVRKPARSRVTPVLQSPVDRCSIVVVTLFTGRRHQARRHCKHVSHPILGDATHGKGPLNRAFKDRYGLARMALHAARVVVVDDDGARRVVHAPLPDDLRGPLTALFPDADIDAALAAAWPP